MSNWQQIRLGDVCSFQNGLAFKSNEFDTNGDYYVIKIKELKNGYVKLFDESSKVFKNGKNNIYSIKYNDVLIALTGDPVNKPNPCSWVGRVAVNKNKEQLYLNQRVAKFCPNDNFLDLKFIYYYFRVYDNFYDLAQKATGSASQANISTKTIEDTVIFVPSLNKQKQIVKILSSLDDKIELNNRINANLEEQAQALFHHWFVDFEFPNEEGLPYKSNGGKFVDSELGKIPEGWKIGTLSEIADYLNGLAMQKFRPQDKELGIPVLKIKELGQKNCDSSSDICSESIKPEYIVNDGDVIFSWSGTLKIDIWCGGICGLNQHLFKVTSKIYPKWFYYYWTKQHLNKFIRIAKDKAVTMGHIKREDLDKSQLSIPNNKNFRTMNNIIGPLLEKQITLNIENRFLIQLCDAILPKLMNNEIKI